MAKTSELEPIVEPMVEEVVVSRTWVWYSSLLQILRFSIVGILNTSIDVLTLNILVLLFPIHNANLLLIYNSIAYLFGALNSFLLNKYWTFKRKHTVTGGELLRFAIINVIGILCNDAIITFHDSKHSGMGQCRKIVRRIGHSLRDLSRHAPVGLRRQALQRGD